MQQRLSALALATVLLAGSSEANVGVFTGTGHTIELAKTEAVQLVSEEVTIIPGRGRFLFDGTVGGLDDVLYICEFQLANLKDEAVSIQAGFPLSSQFYDHGTESEDHMLIMRHRFLAMEVGGAVHTPRFVAEDRDGELFSILLWDMAFEPGETKTLHVSYSMPISMTLSGTYGGELEHPDIPRPAKSWYKHFDVCLLEHFGYVTRTGQSWAGSIESATFRVYVEGFERYLAQRPLTEGAQDDDGAGWVQLLRPPFFRMISPEGWVEQEDGSLVRTIEDYPADEDLRFSYFFPWLPTTVRDLELMLETVFEEGRSLEDLEDFRDFLLEYNGVETGNERIGPFVKDRIWYGQPKQMLVPAEVLGALDLLIESVRQPDQG